MLWAKERVQRVPVIRMHTAAVQIRILPPYRIMVQEVELARLEAEIRGARVDVSMQVRAFKYTDRCLQGSTASRPSTFTRLYLTNNCIIVAMHAVTQSP